MGVPIGELNAIEAGWPTNVKWCCIQMLEKWLDMDVMASWEKIHVAIQSHGLPTSNGKNIAIINTISCVGCVASIHN